jgi:SNF2 family DNA or RNA helicase
LRPYQLEGLRWLNALADVSMESKTGIGGVLADDMGLGKTVMTIAHILWLREKGYLFAPALIVVPASLVGNWESELQKFAPSLSRLKFEGRTADRASRFLEMAGVEVVITTYDLLVRDIQGLREQPFALVVTDEGQRVKNVRTKAASDIRTLLSFRVLDLSGTVLENHLGELHAHLDLAVPGLLGTEKEFAKYYRGPIEKHGDVARLQELRRKIAPFVLRRTKAVVAPDLPPKTEMVQFIELAGAQAALYEVVRLTVKADVRAAIAKHGIKKANITIFDALLKLRQVCCDPRLVKSQDNDRQVPGSAKLDELFEMIETCVAEGRRMLIFSAFAEMLKLISDEARRRDIRHQMLIGETRDRDDQVREFQEGQAPLFLLSLKAGGVGLNLTAADTVIHYDPWWNPAAEAQATDRAHRIGQDKPVFVYRLICKGTVEEKIGHLQGRKASLAAAVLGADASVATSLQFTEADIESFFG